MLTAEAFQTLALYNRWMNERLYATCARLPAEEREADRGAFFGSVHRTLENILWGDQAWLGRFLSERLTTVGLGERMFEDFANLRLARAAMDERLIAWSGSLDEHWLAAPFTFTSGIDGVERSAPAWRYVLHLFNHQTHHRGQVTTLLSQQGLDMGVTDLARMDG